MIQSIPRYAIAYRPKFFTPGGWFAWVAKDRDEHKPLAFRRHVWWPISEAEALAWFAQNLPDNNRRWIPGRYALPAGLR